MSRARKKTTRSKNCVWLTGKSAVLGMPRHARDKPSVQSVSAGFPGLGLTNKFPV